MINKLRNYLLICFVWTWLVGLVLYLAKISLGSPLGLAILALLYMPTPLVAAVISEKGFRRERLKLPQGRNLLSFILLPTGTFIGFVVLFTATLFIAGNLLHLPGFGTLATSSNELMQAATKLFGENVVKEAGSPPPPIVLMLAGIWGAIVAGWTINGLFALGEEYGWRGLMWEELKGRGVVYANIITGTVWGLWHAPLILQGYNFPQHPILGVGMMVVFCISFSFVLSALRERSVSVLSAAAEHGMFNALAVLLIIFALGADQLVGGPLGLLGSAVLVTIGWMLWSKQSAASVARSSG